MQVVYQTPQAWSQSSILAQKVYCSGCTGVPATSAQQTAVKAHCLATADPKALEMVILPSDTDPFHQGLFKRTELVVPRNFVADQAYIIDWHMNLTTVDQTACIFQIIGDHGARPIFQLGLRNKNLCKRGWLLTGFKGLGTWSTLVPNISLDVALTIQLVLSTKSSGVLKVIQGNQVIFSLFGQTMDGLYTDVHVQTGVYQDLGKAVILKNLTIVSGHIPMLKIVEEAKDIDDV